MAFMLQLVTRRGENAGLEHLRDNCRQQRWRRGVSSTMNSVLKTKIFVSKTRACVSKTRSFALNVMNFAAVSLGLSLAMDGRHMTGKDRSFLSCFYHFHRVSIDLCWRMGDFLLKNGWFSIEEWVIFYWRMVIFYWRMMIFYENRCKGPCRVGIKLAS